MNTLLSYLSGSAAALSLGSDVAPSAAWPTPSVPLSSVPYASCWCCTACVWGGGGGCVATGQNATSVTCAGWSALRPEYVSRAG